MKLKKELFKNIGITFGGALVLYYFMLPPLHIQAPSFWVYVILVMVIYIVITMKKKDVAVEIIKKGEVKPSMLVPSKLVYVIIVIVVVILGINLFLSPLFAADAYSRRIIIDDTKAFIEDVAPVDWNSVPLLDKASSQRLGDRAMGDMVDLVSQFRVSDLYTQINFNGEIVRVTPLEYADVIKYFTNRRDGVKGYIIVNSVNGEATLVRLEEGKGMRYMPSALFFENLNRRLRIKYPTKIFGQKTFEIDDEGKPFWIVPTIRYVGIGLREEINGVIVFNPVNAESNFYNLDEVPEWVDHVYNARLITEQINDWGNYRNGFWNSLFAQRNVVNTTEGYNYLAINGDIYMYTGITSVAADQSIVGFVLTNLRTKKTGFYAVSGAKEQSAMRSAEGLVQQMRFNATFPLLINLNDRPTYLLSLKDDAGLVKKFAFVDVADYQRVVATDSSLGIQEAARRYLESLGVDYDDKEDEIIEVRSITSAVIDGTTIYYITDRNNYQYSVSITVNRNLLPFVRVGDRLSIRHVEDGIRVITKIERYR